MSKKPLYRAGENRIIGGVCAGTADYFGINIAIIRLIWVLSALAAGAGIWAYLVAWTIIPENPDAKRKDLKLTSKVKMMKEREKVTGGFKIHGRNPLFGLILMILGAIFLANNFFPELRLDKYWPIIPIGLGFILIFSSHQKK